MGRALLHAKHEVRAESPLFDLTWAQHLLYGDPSTGIEGEARVAAEVKTILAVRFQGVEPEGFAVQPATILKEAAAGFPQAEAVATEASEGFRFLFDRPSEAVRFAITVAHRAGSRGFSLVGTPEDSDEAEASTPPAGTTDEAEASTPPKGMASSGGLRFAVHLGEVSIERVEGRGGVRSVRGIAAEEAKRLVDLAQQGQILLSKPVFDNARAVLSGNEIRDIDEIEWLDHGTYVFKGWESPIEVCEVGEKGVAPLAPPPDTLNAYRKISPDREPVLGWRPALGQIIPTSPKWRLTEKLGEGGFGEVWRAVDSDTGGTRVFKFCFHADRVRALKREVTLFRILRRHLGAHPHIVQIHGLFFEEPPYYIEMEDIQGLDLAQWSARYSADPRLDEAVRLEIVAKAAEALQAAHDAGVIHRDVEPSNILVEGDPGSGADLRVKLTDFGIGRLESTQNLVDITALGFSQTFRATEMSSGSGSRIYMAPELLVGRESSIRSDIYSLGMVLYQMLVRDCERPLTVDWERGVPDPVLLEILRGCLAGDVSERFTNAGEIAHRLRTVAERRKALEQEQDRQRSEARRKRVSRGLAAVAGLSLIVAGALGYGLRQTWIEREKLERSLYHSSIQEAFRAIEEPNPIKAREILFAAPERFRGWEWGWLVQKCHTDHYALRQDSPITVLELSADNRYIVTGDQSGKVCVWDFDSAAPVWEHRAETGEILSIAIDSSSNWAAASQTGRITAWKLQDPETRVVLTQAAPFEGVIRFSPKQPTLAATDGKGWVHLFDLDGGAKTEFQTPHNGPIKDFDFVPEGDRVLTLGQSGQALVPAQAPAPALCCLMDITTGAVVDRTDLPGQSISALSIEGGSNTVAVFAGNHLYRGTLSPLNLSKSDHQLGDSEGGMAYSQDGRYLGFNYSNRRIQILNAETSRSVLVLGGGSGRAHSIRFTRDGDFFVTLDEDGVVRKHQIRGREEDNLLLKGHQGWVRCLEFSPDGNFLATGSEDETVMLWDAKTGEARLTFQTYGKATDLAFSPDARSLIAGTGTGEVFVWKVPSGQEVNRHIAHEGPVVGVSSHPGGGEFATKGADGEIRIWSLEGVDRPLMTLAASVGGVLSYSPEGDSLFSNGGNFSLREWDSETGVEMAVFAGHGSEVCTLDFFPGGDRFASGDKGGGIILWDRALRRKTATFHSQVSLTNELIVTPEGNRIVTSVEIWDLENLRPILPIPVDVKALSPDGRSLAIGGTEQRLRIEGSFPIRMEDLPGDPDLAIEDRMEGWKRAYWRGRGAGPGQGADPDGPVVAGAEGVTGYWDFELETLRSNVGRDLERFERGRGVFESNAQLGRLRSFGLPSIHGEDRGVFHFKGDSKRAGFRVFSNAHSQEGDHLLAYTLIFDLYYPRESENCRRALFNTDASNSDAAELVVSATGGLGVEGVYHGEIRAGEWHRVVCSVNLAGTPRMAKYIDGRWVGTQELPEGLRGRWALLEGRRGRCFLLLAGRDCDVAPCFLDGVQFRDYAMTSEEASWLGGPGPGGIPLGSLAAGGGVGGSRG